MGAYLSFTSILFTILLIGILVVGMVYRKKIRDFSTLWFYVILFNKSEADTVILAIRSKRSTKKYWYFNNIVTPISIVYFPYLLTLVSNDFHIIVFNKTLIDLTFTGAFTMVGINVMRASMTSVNELIDPTHLQDETIFEKLVKDIESIKSKLRSWVLYLTLLGAIAYVLEVGNFLNTKDDHIHFYLIFILVICAISVFFGRLITIVQTNFLDDKALVENWVASLKQGQKVEFANLTETATKGGLL